MSKAEMETKARNDYLDFISTKLSEQYDADVLRVSASELAIPYVDEEGNEKWALVKVSIPRGARNGNGGYDGYDGYAAAEEYKFDLEEKAAKKAKAEEKKAVALAKKEEGKAVKKAVKNLEKAVENAE